MQTFSNWHAILGGLAGTVVIAAPVSAQTLLTVPRILSSATTVSGLIDGCIEKFRPRSGESDACVMEVEGGTLELTNDRPNNVEFYFQSNDDVPEKSWSLECTRNLLNDRLECGVRVRSLSFRRSGLGGLHVDVRNGTPYPHSAIFLRIDDSPAVRSKEQVGLASTPQLINRLRVATRVRTRWYNWPWNAPIDDDFPGSEVRRAIDVFDAAWSSLNLAKAGPTRRRLSRK